MKAPAEKNETALQFYTRSAAELYTQSEILLKMYRARKKQDTPVSEAIWSGHWELLEKSKRHAEKRDELIARGVKS